MGIHIKACLVAFLKALILFEAFLIAPVKVLASQEAQWVSAEEMILPNHISSIMENNYPFLDMLPSEEGGVWFLTQNSLWHLRFDPKTLTHIAINGNQNDKLPLEKIGTDGTSIFAASATSMFQLTWPNRRIFRYDFPNISSGKALGFAGSGDEFSIVHTKGIMRFDPYGKSIKNLGSVPDLREDDLVRYNPKTEKIWRVRGKILERLDLNVASSKFMMLLKTHNPILDLKFIGPNAIVHTSFSVLYLDPMGKILRSIPVEGRRRLISMFLTNEVHAYLFDDHLLEIYQPEKKSIQKVKLDWPSGSKIKKMVLGKNTICLMTQEKMSCFKAQFL